MLTFLSWLTEEIWDKFRLLILELNAKIETKSDKINQDIGKKLDYIWSHLAEEYKKIEFVNED